MTDSKREELIEELTASRKVVIQQCKNLGNLIRSLNTVNIGETVVAKKGNTYTIGVVKGVDKFGIILEDCNEYFLIVEKLSKDVVDKLYKDVSKQE